MAGLVESHDAEADGFGLLAGEMLGARHLRRCELLFAQAGRTSAATRCLDIVAAQLGLFLVYEPTYATFHAPARRCVLHATLGLRATRSSRGTSHVGVNRTNRVDFSC